MSDARPLERGATATRRAVDRLSDAAAARLVPAMRATAFWTAVALPVVYVPLFFSPFDWVISAVLVVHALVVLAGYGHEPDL